MATDDTVTVRDRQWLQAAIELSRRCVPSATAFSVGAVIVDAGNDVIADGYSRDVDAHVHAEESALGRLADGDPRLSTATIYSSLEPCSARKSRPRSCVDLIAAAGIRRVVFALTEPPLFVTGRGAESLRRAGIAVVQLEEFGEAVKDINGHLLR